MKLKSLALAIFCLLFSNYILKATHLAGGEIIYEHVANDSFSVKVKLYRDCNSNVPFNLQGVLRNGCGTKIFTLSSTKVNDITGISPSCGINSRCSGSYPFGIEEHIFEGGFKLLNDTCCQYTISVTQCCRSSTITTGPDNSVLYLEASFNKCLAPKNFSPKFVNTPTFLVEVGDFKNITTSALDTIDGDSLSYELVRPYSSNSSQVGYSGAFSTLKPLTFSGFPNQSLASPQGFHFDKRVGDFEFTPVLKNQVTVIAVKVKEWRKVNGTTRQIGEIMREFQLTVIRDTTNKPPIFTKIDREIEICSDTGKYYFDIPIVDSNITNRVYLSYSSNIKNITFTKKGTKISQPTVEVYITVDSSMVNATALQQFTIRASDSVCNLPGVAEKTYYLKFARKALPDSFSVSTSLTNCREITASMANNSSISAFNTFWQLTNSKDTITKQGDTSFTAQATDTGWHYLQLSISSSQYCEDRVILDSVYINKERFFNISLGADKTYCFKNSDTLNLADTLIKGIAPYTYKWSTDVADINPTVVTNLDTGENKFWVTVTDANNCVSSDTIIIGSYSPKVTLSYPPKVCYRDNFKISASLEGAKSPQFEWVGYSKNQLSINTIQYADSNYRFLLTDTFGCKIDTTINIPIWNPTIEIDNVSKCASDTIALSYKAINAVHPLSFTWTVFFVNDTQAKRSVAKDSLFIPPPFPKDSIMVFLYAGDSNGCAMGDTIIVYTNQNPKPVIKQIYPMGKTSICQHDTLILIDSNSVNNLSYTPTWHPGAVTADTLTILPPHNTGTLNVKLKLAKGSGCSGVDSLDIVVVSGPTVTINAINRYCKSDSSLNNLYNFTTPKGGRWLGNGISNDSIFIAKNADTGINLLTYVYKDSLTGCANTDTVSVLVQQPVIPNFTASKTTGIVGDTIWFTNQTTNSTIITNRWDFGDFGKPGNVVFAQNPSYKYNDTGKYSVKLWVYDSICPPDSIVKTDYITITSTVSVKELVSNKIKLYPNPAKDKLIIEADEEIKHITIINAIGKKVYSEVGEPNSTTIDVSNLKNGFYWIEISFASGVIQKVKIAIDN